VYEFDGDTLTQLCGEPTTITMLGLGHLCSHRPQYPELERQCFELDHPEPERQLLGEPSTIASPEYTELERQPFGNPVPEFCSGNRYINTWLI
jgi:hypothetical protein